MTRIRRIVFASDFSPASRPAFAAAQDLAKALKAELLLMHALEPIIDVSGVYPPYVGLAALEKASRLRARSQIEGLATAARKRRLRVQTVLVKGYPADQILRLSRSRKADLIVMGTQGRTGFSRFVMGSVATRVASGSRCPVMIVRATGA